MGLISLDQLRQLPDYAQATKWNLTFLSLPTVGPFAFGTSDALNQRTVSIDQPHGAINNFKVQVRGHTVMQAGIIDYGNEFKITFTETVDSAIMKLIKAWREMMWASRQGTAFPKSQLEATILLELTDNQGNVRAQITYYGCMYKDCDLGVLDGNTSDALKPSLTLSYDFFLDNPLTISS